jgi:hypothetical protein
MILKCGSDYNIIFHSDVAPALALKYGEFTRSTAYSPRRV